MEVLERKRVAIETGLRMVADVIMTNLALAIGMLARSAIEIQTEGNGPPQDVFLKAAEDYVHSFWILTIILLVVAYLSGFYTRGRYYQGRYKALVVVQAVSVSYLIFACVAFLSQGAISFPRSVLAISWVLTCGLLVIARLWSMLWKRVEGVVVSAQSPLLGRRRGDRVGSLVENRGPKKILVIGGAGYIGSALLPKLLDRGYQVRLMDRFLFGKEPIANVLGNPNLEIIQGDFRHVDKLIEVMRGVDQVIHLGAIVGDPACSLDQQLTVEINLIATRMIAAVAKGSGIRRFCFASTCSVYGASNGLLEERSQVNPISLYAQSKLASEKILTQLADHTFSPVILRFGTVYGLSGRTRFDLVVNLLTAKAVVEGKITLSGGGQWRPFLHVDDAALALLKAAEAPTDLIHGEIFNVGSYKQNYRLQDVAQVIQSLVPGSEIVDMGAGTDFRNYRVDFTKIFKMLGFTPQWSLEDGVKQVIGVLKSEQVRDYQHPMYSNVKFLSEESNSHLIPRETGWAHKMIDDEKKLRAGSEAGIPA